MGINGKALIHIWDTNNLSNVAFISSSHRGTIKMMSFINNDQLLVTVGNLIPTPLIFYRWTQELEVDSRLIWDVPIEMYPLRTDSDNVIEIIMETKITEMTINNDFPHFIDYCKIEESEDIRQKKITTGTLIHNNESESDIISRIKIIGITGHCDGNLFYWSKGKIPSLLCECKEHIVSIKPWLYYFTVTFASGTIILVFDFIRIV